MQGKATINDHPIHPMLVAFPIGFFGGVLVSDVISIWGDKTFWPSMSLWLIAFGIIGALLAAVFGFTDYLTAGMSPAVKRTAMTHMILNLTVVALYVAFFVRFATPMSVLGYVLTYVALGTLVVSGWFGGRLVYVDLVGTRPQAGEIVEGRTLVRAREPVIR
jgi:uncharacterized membrane protein